MIKNIISLFIGLLIVVSFPSRAKTLIVTHPQTTYDDERESVAGFATTALLQDSQYQKRIVLWSIYGGNATFLPSVLTYEEWPSNGGEVPYRLMDSEFTLAGGYFELCLQETLFDLIRHSTGAKPLRLTIKMNATYGVLHSVLATLAKFENKKGRLILVDILQKYTQELSNRLPKNCAGLLMRQSEPIRIDLQLHGENIGHFGSGAKSVILNYD